MDAGSGKATASMVLGIISLLGICSPIVGIVCGIIAIALSAAAMKAGSTDGKLKAGLIMGIIGIAVGVVNWIISIAILGSSGLMVFS